MTDNRRRRGGGRLARPRTDDGLTLTELVVSMGIFTVVVAISLTMLRSMTTATLRVATVNEARTDVDRLYSRLDKQAPYADAINAAGQSGGDWWIEFRTDVTTAGLPPRCWQYRLNTASRIVSARSWPIGDGGGATAWATLLQDAQARNGAGAPAPFTMIPSTTDVTRQRLVVALDVVATGAPPVPLDTTYVARNTSTTTVTNTAGNAVCTEVART